MQLSWFVQLDSFNSNFEFIVSHLLTWCNELNSTSVLQYCRTRWWWWIGYLGCRRCGACAASGRGCRRSGRPGSTSCRRRWSAGSRSCGPGPSRPRWPHWSGPRRLPRPRRPRRPGPGSRPASSRVARTTTWPTHRW